MRRRGLIGTVVIAILVIALAVILAATYFTLKYFVVVNWQLFPKNQELLDLRAQALTMEEYNAIAWRLPTSKIYWSVPFQGGYVGSDQTELTITQLHTEDLDAIGYMSSLEVIHAQQCTDYPVLLELYNTYPNIRVEYTVPLSSQNLGPEASSISITSLTEEDLSLLEYLPNLKTIDGTRCRDYSAMEKLKASHPEWNITYTTSIAGTRFQPDSTTLELTGADYDELYVGLAAMSDLKTVLIHSPKASAEELEKVRAEYPNLEIHWEVEVYGLTFADDAEEVDISSRPIDSISVAKEVASKFPKLKKLIVDSGSIPDEDMAAYRDEVRSSYKVVWTVYFSPLCKARTDETYFMPIKQGEYYFQEKHVYPLRYCEDMICIDVGHSTIATCDFAAYMPHLKYLILAWTQVTDITPLSNCKELVYLEIDHGIVRDLTPLQGCTALEDLNINDQQSGVVKIDPLLTMTWLKTLWCPDRPYNEKMQLQEALPDTRVVMYEIGNSTGLGWRNLQNYYDMRDILGMSYMR